ncbi:cation:proton antiporter [Pleurocapsales cyanobacterium LEGE 06147]|nr:cation:proton antiporter [Pleurocapsales cyanobacterium LEGE 06147]
MTTETLAAIALFILAFGLISKPIEKSVITPPMVFTIFGLLLSPQLLGLLNVNIKSEIVLLFAEFTLILVLFTDVSRIHLKLLFQEYDLPLRLLGIGLPVMIILGTFGANIFFQQELTIWEAAALATILAPTDAALGQAVVSSPRVPLCIRQSLNVESGLNDGICLPILLIFLSLATSQTAAAEATSYWLSFSAKQVILGPIVGIAVGYIGGWLLLVSSDRRWITESFRDLSVLGLSLLAYTLAEIIGGNGFISAFCAGLTLGNTARFLILLTFMIYGAIMVLPALPELTWQIVFYAIVSLLIVRSASVAISTIGMKLRGETLVFLGWFGPRGVASVLYGLLVLEETAIQGSSVIFTTMVITVLISIFAHGITAFLGANWYGDRIDQLEAKQPELPELKSVREMPVRLPWNQ